MSGGWFGRSHFEALLCDLFDEAAIRRWLRLRDDGDVLATLIPGPPIALRELVHAATEILLRHSLVDVQLFERLAREFPGRSAEIKDVLRQWIQTRPVGIPCPRPEAVDPAHQALGERLEQAYQRREALICADQDNAEVDREILEIRRELRQGPQLKSGDSLDHGRYRLIARIGAGGYASVWRAYDRERRTIVAIRVLHGHRSGDLTCRERFERGARNMARVHHPGVVPVLRGVFEDGGYLAYVMELFSGGDLRARVLAGSLDAAQILELSIALCAAVHAAHAVGIVHRDIKPSNVLLDVAGAPRLTDFDMMRADDTTGGTASGLGMGTFVYAAPEVMRDATTADERSDIFSLGMTLLFCLSGRDLDFDVLVDPTARLAELRCHPDIKQVIRQALRRRPADRFGSAADMRAALERSRHPSPAVVDLGPVITVPRSPGLETILARLERYTAASDWNRDVYPTRMGQSLEFLRGDTRILDVGAVVGTIDFQGRPTGLATQALFEFAGPDPRASIAIHGRPSPGDILITPGGQATCANLYLYVQDLVGVQDSSEAAVTDLVARCLARASDVGLESLAFPLLFAGTTEASMRASLRHLFLALHQQLATAPRLRRAAIVVDDHGESLTRTGGAVSVVYPLADGENTRQTFALGHHLTLFGLGSAIWHGIPAQHDVPPYTYGKRWLLRDRSGNTILDGSAMSASYDDHSIAPRDAGIVDGAVFEVILLQP
jgi:serine/threonine protein kinase